MAKSKRHVVTAAKAGGSNGMQPPAVPQFVIEFDDPFIDGVCRTYTRLASRPPQLKDQNLVLFADDEFAAEAIKNYLFRIGTGGPAGLRQKALSAIETFNQYSQKK